MRLSIGVLCSGNLGFKLLEQIFNKYGVKFVFTDTNSKQIKEFCTNEEIPCFIGNPRNGKASNFIKNYTSDILISVNYLFIIEKDVIEMGRKLTFNVHGSLLPKYRGRTPHVWSIINGEKYTGITAHLIDEGCDTGDILSQIEIPIECNDTGNDVLLKFYENYLQLIDSVIELFKNGEFKPLKQDDRKATYFGKRTPEDGQINWNWQKQRIYNWIRAQANPYPGAFSYYDNQRIIIDEIEFSDFGYNNEMRNGEILNLSPLLIKTPNGVIEIKSIRESVKFKIGGVLK